MSLVPYSVWAPLCGPHFSEVVLVCLNVTDCLSIYLCIRLSIHPSIYLSINPSIRPLHFVALPSSSLSMPYLLRLLSELADYMRQRSRRRRRRRQQQRQRPLITIVGAFSLIQRKCELGRNDVLEIEGTLPARLSSGATRDRHQSRSVARTVTDYESVGNDDRDDRYSEKKYRPRSHMCRHASRLRRLLRRPNKTT